MATTLPLNGQCDLPDRISANERPVTACFFSQLITRPEFAASPWALILKGRAREKVRPMVSATDALRAAIYDGLLEKRRRTGGWKKKHFVLTHTHLLSFDSVESSDARSSLSTVEILSVQANESDAQQRSFQIALYKHKKEFRAATTDDRNAWVEAIESVSPMKKDNQSSSRSDSTMDISNEASTTTMGSRLGGRVSAVGRTNSSHVPENAAATLVGASGVDLLALCEQMKKSFSWQLQISKSFTGKDFMEFLRNKFPDATPDATLAIGQDLIDNKLVIPLKSHLLDDQDLTARFKFVDAAGPKAPKNHLNMRSQSIADLMGHTHFDATKYAEDFLRKHSSEKIDAHCKKLILQKEKTIDELKEEISVNYTSFIKAVVEIKTMENSVSELKMLVLDCKRSIQTLKNVNFDTTPVKKEIPSYESAEKKREERAKSKALDSLIHDLEVYLHERNYDDFTRQALDFKRKAKETPDFATGRQQTTVHELLQLFVRKLVDEFNASMQTSERMHKKESHLKYLIQLGETHLATEMCLQNYSVRIAMQLRHVPSYGNALNYVINLSRTFFTTLLVCYEDYELSFRGQKSAHFIALTVWISAQLERFANDILCHIFPNDLQNPLQATSTHSSTAAIDVPEFKNVAKYVASALRYVFYGSRQLELAGLPTAHCLAPHLVRGLIFFLESYARSIKSTMKQEIKRERWEMAKRTIRDPDNKTEREIILTQSARSFYSMIQQYLRDAQRVLNPSCATSFVAEVHEAVVLEADDVMIRYTIEITQYMENPKLSSSLRLKQIVGLLTNIAYVQDDCATRSNQILHEFITKAALQNREVETQNSRHWRTLVQLGTKRCAQSILSMSIQWKDMDLSEESLPDIIHGKKDTPVLFVHTLMQDLSDITNGQLEKAIRKQAKRDVGADNMQLKQRDEDDDGNMLVSMILEAMLDEVHDDSSWWEQLAKGSKDKRISVGYAGMNKFIAELQVLSQTEQATKRMEQQCELLIAKITDTYKSLHPEKKQQPSDAPKEWMQAYITMVTHSCATSAT